MISVVFTAETHVMCNNSES